MWMIELATKTNTAESRIGTTSPDRPVMTPPFVVDLRRDSGMVPGVRQRAMAVSRSRDRRLGLCAGPRKVRQGRAHRLPGNPVFEPDFPRRRESLRKIEACRGDIDGIRAFIVPIGK